MKKYVKPELFYENFELTTQVAACAFDHNRENLAEEFVCIFRNEDTGLSVFTDALSCDFKKEEIVGGGGGDCYFTGGADSSGTVCFNS